jgi:hypothetical protein
MVPKGARRRTKARKEESQFAKNFCRGNITFWAVLSEVMKQRSGKVQNGRLPIPHDHKIFVSPNRESKQRY